MSEFLSLLLGLFFLFFHDLVDVDTFACGESDVAFCDGDIVVGLAEAKPCIEFGSASMKEQKRENAKRKQAGAKRAKARRRETSGIGALCGHRKLL